MHRPMLPAALVIAGLAVPEVPPRPPAPPVVIETSWSLAAGTSPLALIGPTLPAAETAGLADQPVGPGQLNPPPTISPAPPQEPRVEVLTPEQAAAAEPEVIDDLADDIRPADDPLEGFNRISFAISMALDKVLIRPVAMVYKTVVPKPLRDGARNALSNLGEPLVFLNDLLQGKPERALRTLGRFLLNSVLGIGGLFDIAKEKKFGLPHHSNSLANTLGFYGVKPGPYVYLPILGPTTLRDFAGSFEGRIPGAINADALDQVNGLATAATIVGGLDQRVENDFNLRTLLEDAVDPYATFRSTWLQDRAGEIAGLKAPDGTEPGSALSLDPLDDPLIDPAAPEAEPEMPEPAPAEAEAGL
jgi:phospholipid-binding lipoprotein MlaA